MRRSLQRLSQIAQDGVSTTKVIEESNTGGLKKITETVYNMRWSTMSRNQKLGLGVFVSGGVGYNMFHTYNSGKEELFRHRSEMKNTRLGNKKYETEWDAVYAGCTKDSWTVFYKSLIWPVSIASQVVPSMVMWLNKEDGDVTGGKGGTVLA